MPPRKSKRTIKQSISAMASKAHGDVAALATSHACVRSLVETNEALAAQNERLAAQMAAQERGMRGMRLLLRDPSARLLQPVAHEASDCA